MLGRLRRYLAVVLSVYAALLHDWVIPEHYREWWGYGAYLVVAGAAQVFLAGLLLLWPDRRTFLIGIVGNCGILILYAGSTAPVVSGQPTFDFFERRYVFHCHNIDHEDHDMMAQFRIMA